MHYETNETTLNAHMNAEEQQTQIPNFGEAPIFKWSRYGCMASGMMSLAGLTLA